MMPVEAEMKFVGEIDGRKVFWAEPGRFETAGIYYWNGRENVHVPLDIQEQCASLHESINPASDDERSNGVPGAGAMGAVIEYRDAIRRLPKR